MLRRVLLSSILLALSAAPSAMASTATATYQAKSFNFDTGIYVAAGDTISAIATSNLNLCGGTRPCIDQTFEDGRIAPTSYNVGGFAIPNAGAGGGFYKIGNGAWTPFTAKAGGLSVSNPVAVATSGKLFITTNDILFP